MKKLLYIILLLSFFMSSTLSGKIIKIAIISALSPYTFIDDKNNAAGIVIDYWKLWAKKTQTKIEFIPYTWEKSLDAIKNEDVDIHSALFKSKKRAADIHYLDPFLQVSTKLYVYNKKISEVKNFKMNNWLYAAISKDKADFASFVLMGMRQITNAEIKNIEKKWIKNKKLQEIKKKNNLDVLRKDEKENIRNKWIENKINTAIDYRIIYQLLFVFLLILIISLYFIAKLRVANFAIKEQKENFETLFRDTSEGLLLYKHGKIIDCNSAALSLLKYTEKKSFLKKELQYHSPALQPNGENSSVKFMSLVKECFKNGHVSFEWVHLKSTGEHCWLDILLTKIMIDKEYVIHCVWRDIAEKKILETKVKRRTQELEDKNIELNNTNEDIKKMQLQLVDAEKMASLGSLVAGVSHEINTPIGIGLTSVSYFVEMSTSIKERYKNDLMTQEAFEDFLSTSEELSNLIYKNLKKAAVLIKSFKTVAVDQSSEEKRVFYFNEYIEEILNSIHPFTKKTNIVIEVHCDEKLKVNSYPGPFSQVITNLIMNSIIHGFNEKEKGLIIIDIKEKKEQIHILFTDNGKGIKKENLAKVFDPFFTTNRENGGSGLGLNITSNIITKTLNGSITCRSIENEGVVFEIFLNI